MARMSCLLSTMVLYLSCPRRRCDGESFRSGRFGLLFRAERKTHDAWYTRQERGVGCNRSSAAAAVDRLARAAFSAARRVHRFAFCTSRAPEHDIVTRARQGKARNIVSGEVGTILLEVPLYCVGP